MKINKTWDKRDLEGTDSIVHCRYTETVEVYCKLFFKCSKSGWQKKRWILLSGVSENMCPACFWRLLPLISKSHWNREMRIMQKPSKPIGLWSLSTQCFKPFLEISISVQFRSQMEFSHWIQTASQATIAVCLGRGLEQRQIKSMIEVHGPEVCLKLAPHLHKLCAALSQCFKSQISTDAPAHQICSRELYVTSLKSIYFSLTTLPPSPFWHGCQTTLCNLFFQFLLFQSSLINCL